MRRWKRLANGIPTNQLNMYSFVNWFPWDMYNMQREIEEEKRRPAEKIPTIK